MSLASMIASTHWLAVFLAALASWLLGVAWYMGLGKPWMAAVEKTEAELMGPDGKPSPIPFVASFVLQVLMAAVLFGVLYHVARAGGVGAGVLTGFLCWLGFVLPVVATNNLYQKRKPMLTVIDAGYFLGVLLVQGAVLGWFASGR